MIQSYQTADCPGVRLLEQNDVEKSQIEETESVTSSSMESSSLSISSESDEHWKALSWAQEWESIWRFIASEPICVLLILIPFGIWCGVAKWNDTVTFTINFLIMIPLAKLLSESTEVIACHTGDVCGGLVNATFGNAVELVMAMLALRKGEFAVVQSSLIGSVLSNMLFVLGSSFLAGGIRSSETTFSSVVASANLSLLMLANFAMLLSSYVYFYMDFKSEGDKMKTTLTLSRISALVLLFLYMQFLVFQLWTHFQFFRDEQVENVNVRLSLRASGVVLLGLTILVSVISNFLVSSIDGYTKSMHISKTFVGIVLLPIVGNAVEHLTAIKVAMNGKMELAVGVAIGSATQVALFIVPIVVLVGGILGQPLTLAFPKLDTLIYLMAVVIVYMAVADGKSNWLEGAMLLTAYVLIAIALLCVPS